MSTSLPVIQVENITKRYRLGAINRSTFADELKYRWLKFRGRDPAQELGKLGSRPLRPKAEDFWALKGISFEVKKGEVIGLIGGNGSGKSTTLKILSRITEPTSGRAFIRGQVGSLLEVGTGFHPELTGRENIFMNGTILGMKRNEIAAAFDAIVDFSGVERFLDTPVKRYSSGMYVRLAFSVASHLRSEILLIDEVLAVGDASFQRKCLGKMSEIARDGRTILFVSHNMAAVENLCSRCILLNSGQVIAEGSTRDVVASFYAESERQLTSISLGERKDRSGSGEAIVDGFWIEGADSTPLVVTRSGLKTVFVIRLANRTRATIRDLNVGLSLSDSMGLQIYSVINSNFHNRLFDLPPEGGEVRLAVDDFPLSPGKYRLGVRLSVSGQEVDCPENGVDWLEVGEGDFYGTGRRGFAGKAPFMMKGDWTFAAK